MRASAAALICILIASAASCQSPDADPGWTSWRGPDGTGSVRSGNPPSEWSEEKNVLWKVRLPGDGSSTPIILGNRIYVTTAVATDRPGKPVDEKPPERAGGGTGRGGRGGGGRGGPGGGNNPVPDKVYEFLVLALDRDTGKTVWSRKVTDAVPHEGGHATASHASGSPLTDGEHLYAYFGSQGIHCLKLDGEVKWSKDLGTLWTRNHFGEGSTPGLYGDTLVINWDHEGDSFIAALDKRTGKELWRQSRDESTSWATPVFATVKGSVQVITTGTKASRAYDLKTGEPLWTCKGMTDNCIPTPIVTGTTAYLMSGFRGAALQAIQLEGAKGDLTGSKHLLWSLDRNTSYVPSALLHEGLLYFLRSNNGVLTCVDARSGTVVYEGERLAGLRTIYASPVGAGSNVYITSREGTTMVIKAGRDFAVVATNQLDDTFDGSAALAGDRLYLRGRKHLYCLAAKK